jgi:hypothetical protein
MSSPMNADIRVASLSSYATHSKQKVGGKVCRIISVEINIYS